MNNPSATTVILMIAISILGLYAAGEVNYYSCKSVLESNVDFPVITIPAIGVNEKINNVSVSQGVYHDNRSFVPANGEIVLYGHRTLQGSPFLRLDQLDYGDTVTLNWPEIGEINYTVINKTIVSENEELKYSDENSNIFLITCDPIGSTANRLIVEGNMISINKLNSHIIKENPQKYNSLIIIIIFLTFGSIISYFYLKSNRIYLIATVLTITVILVYFYFFPIPSDIIYSRVIG